MAKKNSIKFPPVKGVEIIIATDPAKLIALWNRLNDQGKETFRDYLLSQGLREFVEGYLGMGEAKKTRQRSSY